MLIPSDWDSEGELYSAFLLFIKISPLSFLIAPDKTFINVDLPAPFSPTRQ